MNKRRLKILAQHLRTIPKKHFNLIGWGDVDGGKFSDAIIKVGCDTAACAVGWAPSIPALRTAGFKLHLTPWGALEPIFRSYEGWEATQKFFDLSADQAEYLFLCTKYNRKDHSNPIVVADRIMEFIA